MMEHILFIFVLLQVALAVLGVKFIHIYTIRQSEKALRVGEERYKTLVENLNVGVYRSTGETTGRYLQVNPAMIKIFGYESVDEFMDISISDLYRNPEGRKEFVDKIKGIGYVRNEELALCKKDGTPIIVSVTAVAQFEDSGEIKWIDGITEDITERKQAEAALRESEEKYRSLATTVDSMYMIDRYCRYILMNEGHLKRFGLHWKRLLANLTAISIQRKLRKNLLILQNEYSKPVNLSSMNIRVKEMDNISSAHSVL
jgi:PAS domain S-box-containing protein